MIHFAQIQSKCIKFFIQTFYFSLFNNWSNIKWFGSLLKQLLFNLRTKTNTNIKKNFQIKNYLHSHYQFFTFGGFYENINGILLFEKAFTEKNNIDLLSTVFRTQYNLWDALILSWRDKSQLLLRIIFIKNEGTCNFSPSRVILMDTPELLTTLEVLTRSFRNVLLPSVVIILII